MVKWRSYGLLCEKCGNESSGLFDMDNGEAVKELEEGLLCEACGTPDGLKKALTCAVRTAKTSASFVDGHKRPEFTKMREQRRLEKALKAAKRLGDKEVFTDVVKEAAGKDLTIKGLPKIIKE
jgi:hypothetical protein